MVVVVVIIILRRRRCTPPGLFLDGVWEGSGLVLGSFLGAFWLSCGVLTAMRSESNTRVLYSRPGKPDLTDFRKFWRILGSVLGAF